MMSKQLRVLVVCGITLATLVGLALVGPIPQDEDYHVFADRRSMMGISNFLNVASNLPFLLVGIAGLIFVTSKNSTASTKVFLDKVERWPYILFFIGVTLTCFGSSYYHLSPTSERLMWDRIPMSIAFMSLLSAVIAERLSVKAGLLSLVPFVFIGVGSVIYWRLGAQSGHGDLRPYIIVQFYSLLAVVLVAAFFPSRYTRTRDIFVSAGIYALAKLVEILDSAIFAIGGIVSGHTLKHIVAAGSIYAVLQMLKHRVPALMKPIGPIRPIGPMRSDIEINDLSSWQSTV